VYQYQLFALVVFWHSVATVSVDHTVCRATFAEHLTNIPHKCDWLLVSREVTTMSMFADKHNIVSRIEEPK
jgi:hypothetical protein